ncbi:SDR family oxidoreductase [Kribbella sp. NPDC056861]|uniref:SDR family NAD(P)-dependent oxidoreductase n=1 Tax=Kribbella sp. NPDC056861 TaxID=3154857 RepID=UPI0034258622
MDWLGLAGQRALVAGAGGIGAEAALGLAAAGATVVAADIDQTALRDLEQRANAAGTGLKTVLADLSTAAGCRDAVERADALLNGLDIFVHAVGVNDRRPILDTPDELWERILAINLDSAFWTGKAAGALMRSAGRGRIVYLSSVAGLLGHADHGPYAASKGGINQLCRVMAREWAPHGITVNAVAPGYTETDLTRQYLDKPGVRAGLTALVPTGRLGTVADLAGPILFLCSAQSTFVTGQILYVDGGRTLV